jgi:hypothetical protein
VPIDYSVPASPGWWLAKLYQDLAGRQERLEELHDYYCGKPEAPQSAPKGKTTAAPLRDQARSNFAALIVEAVNERMQPVGFRTGATSDDTGDAEAWKIWQANALDADAMLVHRASLAMGDAYVIVGPAMAPGDPPVITPEDPRQVITAQDPIKRRMSIAALKVYRDHVFSQDVAYLYLPGVVWRAVKTDAQRIAARATGPLAGWEWDGDPQPTGVAGVPVVRFANRMGLDGKSMGEFEDVIDILNRINTTTLERLVITRFQAFRQRAILGNLPETDADGNQMDYGPMFSAGPNTVWNISGDGTGQPQMWESAQSDITPVQTSVKADIQNVAAITRTPLFYLTPDAAAARLRARRWPVKGSCSRPRNGARRRASRGSR